MSRPRADGELVTVVQCRQCAMLPAHVRYQVKADNSTVAVSSQQSGEFPRQLSVSAPVSSSSSRSVPASWQPRAGTRVAGVALSHARLPRGSATCLRSADWTPAADLCSNTVLALPSPLQLPAPYYPRPVLPRAIGHVSQAPDLRQPAFPRSAPDRRHPGPDPRGPSPRLFRGCEAGAGCSKRGHMGAEMTGGHALAGAVLQHWY